MRPPGGSAGKGADGVDERTEERTGHGEERFARTAERSGLDGRPERANGHAGLAGGRFAEANGRGGLAGGGSAETNGRGGLAGGRSAQEAGLPGQADGRFKPSERRPDGLKMDLLARELDRLSVRLERAKISEYVDLLNRPMSLIWRNFVGGMARGIGIAIGFTFFAATILYVLQMLGKLNLPIIGDYIADIVRIVQRQLEGRAY